MKASHIALLVKHEILKRYMPGPSQIFVLEIFECALKSRCPKNSFKKHSLDKRCNWNLSVFHTTTPEFFLVKFDIEFNPFYLRYRCWKDDQMVAIFELVSFLCKTKLERSRILKYMSKYFLKCVGTEKYWRFRRSRLCKTFIAGHNSTNNLRKRSFSKRFYFVQLIRAYLLRTRR